MRPSTCRPSGRRPPRCPFGDRRIGRLEVSGHDERQLLAPLSEAWVQVLSDTLLAVLAPQLVVSSNELKRADVPSIESSSSAG